MEVIAIFSVGVALAGLILRGQHRTDRQISVLGGELRSLSERVARLEGLVQGVGMFVQPPPGTGGVSAEQLQRAVAAYQPRLQ